MNMTNTSRVAIVYDRVNTFGGAERVLVCLHELYPDAPLYTSVFDAGRATWTKGWKVIPSFLHHFPWLRSRHQYLGLFMPLAFESFDFSQYDLVISVTSEAAKGIITKPGTKHVCYLLTPMRYLWNKSKEYEHDFYAGWRRIFLPLHRLAIHYLRWWDVVAAQRPDLIIPISQTVKQRAERYYKRKIGPVIYPPLNTKLFNKNTRPHQHIHQHHFPFSSFYLCVGRLVPYKRIDLAIEACTKLKKNLVIIGIGSDEGRLRKLAGNSPHIVFIGYLTDEHLVEYYQQCTGLLFPGEEDFGLTVLEAMAVGKPVVTFAGSGHTELVLPNITGVVFTEQNVHTVVQAIIRLEQQSWNTEEIQHHAHQFDQAHWKHQWRSVV